MNTEIRPRRLFLKTLCLFVLINIVYVLVDPPFVKLSIYNSVFPGRVRLPFGDAADPYTVMVDNVDVMIASHIISRPKAESEFRVVLLGDSSVWGENLTARESLGEQWNQANLQCRGRAVRVYNLGYPHPSVLKDLIILDKAIEYEPDLIIWFITLNTLIPQRVSPFLLANRERALHLLETYNIPFRREDALLEKEEAFYQQTLLGERSDLARWLKLQMLGIIWTGTDADTGTPIESARTISRHVENDKQYRGIDPRPNLDELMLFQALDAGRELAETTPILIVNEPMYIARGSNSAVRYNDVYPRWAYDQYREVVAAHARAAKWKYRDMWNSLPPKFFPHTPLHPSAEGERMLIEKLNPTLQRIACK